MATSSGLEKLVGKILEEWIVPQARFAAGLCEVIWFSPDAAHNGPTKIHEKLLVFHAARAGWSCKTRATAAAARSISASEVL
jgi:hypothetical protein